MKKIGLLVTKENAIASIMRRKTQTRRLATGVNRYGQKGDLLYLQEPTQVLHLCKPKIGADCYSVAIVQYRDGLEEKKSIGIRDYNLLLDRKDWRKPATSRFMLKSFARYWFVNEGVREEFLQDISEEDAIAEGIECNEHFEQVLYRNYQIQEYCAASWLSSPITSYQTLWDSINGKKAPWSSNPLVQIISYQITPSPIEMM